MTKGIPEALDAFAEAAVDLALAYRSEKVATAPPAGPVVPLAPLEPFEDTPQGRSAGGGCPRHGMPWVVRPAGNSKKTGEPYNAFWHCNEQNDDGSFCREKPAPAWQKAHPAG